MAYGFLAYNKDREVLISSDTKNLFLNKTATYAGVIATSTAGGPSTRLSYTVSTSKQPVPLFTHPYATYSKAVTAYFYLTSRSEQQVEYYELITYYYYSLLIYLTDISGVSVGQMITFDTGNAVVSANTPYYIVSISANYIYISSSRNGAALFQDNMGSSWTTTSTTAVVTNDPVFVSVTRVTYISGTTWEIELLVSSTNLSMVPVVYIFTEYENTMDRKGSYGMLVLNSIDNGVCFDTRLNPLAITATKTVRPPDSPYTRADSTIQSALNPTAAYTTGLSNGELKPDSVNNYLLSTILPANPVYFYMSIAQSWKRFDTYIDESYSYNNNTYGKNYVTIHKYTYYQTFSRTGICPSIVAGKMYIKVGWTVVNGAAGGPTPDTGQTTRNVSDGYILQGNPGSTYGDDGYWAGDKAQVGISNAATGTWLAAQSQNIKDQVVMVADISRNI